MKAIAVILLVLGAWTAASFADPVSDFSLPGIDGRQYGLDQYAGKWIVINYWATNCPPCIKEVPELQDFYRRHRDTDAVVLGVNYEDIRLSWLKDFVASMKVSYPVLLGKPDTGSPFGPITMLPTTFIVSPDGRFMGQQRGAITAQMLDGYLERQAGHVESRPQRTPSAGGVQ